MLLGNSQGGAGRSVFRNVDLNSPAILDYIGNTEAAEKDLALIWSQAEAQEIGRKNQYSIVKHPPMIAPYFTQRAFVYPQS